MLRYRNLSFPLKASTPQTALLGSLNHGLSLTRIRCSCAYRSISLGNDPKTIAASFAVKKALCDFLETGFFLRENKHDLSTQVFLEEYYRGVLLQKSPYSED
ncbi:MAG: hypothetical protein RR218_09335, partial [Gordonibacter sp.]